MSDKILSHEQKVENLLIIIARSQIMQTAVCLSSLEDAPHRQKCIDTLAKDEEELINIIRAFNSSTTSPDTKER